AAHRVGFQVHHHAVHVVRKLQEFTGQRFFEAVNTGNSVARLEDLSDLGQFQLPFKAFQLLLNHVCNFFRSDCHVYLLYTLSSSPTASGGGSILMDSPPTTAGNDE